MDVLRVAIEEAARGGHDHVFVGVRPTELPFAGLKVSKRWFSSRYKVSFKANKELMLVSNKVTDDLLAKELRLGLMREFVKYPDLGATYHVMKRFVEELESARQGGDTRMVRVFYRYLAHASDEPSVYQPRPTTVYVHVRPYAVVKEVIGLVRARFRRSPLCAVVVGKVSDTFILLSP